MEGERIAPERLKKRQERINNRGEEILERLIRFENEAEGIRKELVFLLTEATKLQQSYQELEQTQAEFESHMEDKADEMRKKRKRG